MPPTHSFSSSMSIKELKQKKRKGRVQFDRNDHGHTLHWLFHCKEIKVREESVFSSSEKKEKVCSSWH